MVPRLVAGNKKQLEQVEAHNKLELSLEEKAEKVKESLDKGVSIKAFLPDYQQAYKEVYGE